MNDYEFTETTPTDATEDTYESVYEAVYNALTDYSSDSSTNTKSLSKVSESKENEITNDMLEFGTETDATMYTLSAEPQTCAQQSTMYLLEIRNLLLIFILGYFILTLFYRFKNSIFSFTR